MENKKTMLCGALKALGIKSKHVHVVNRFNRGWVYLNGEYFGVFDYARNTFVD